MIRNLLDPLPDASAAEIFDTVLTAPGCRIERIVSEGQTTPVDRPYHQDHDEWVLLLSGRAVIEVDGQTHTLEKGDTLMIPAGAAHRVTYTDIDRPTVWLAVHLESPF